MQPHMSLNGLYIMNLQMSIIANKQVPHHQNDLAMLAPLSASCTVVSFALLGVCSVALNTK